jgi:hypothetical protein
MQTGTSDQKLHVGNNLTNHLSGSPARTPTLKVSQLLMLGLQPYRTSATWTGSRAEGLTNFWLCLAMENHVRYLIRGDPQRLCLLSLLSSTGIFKYSHFAKSKNKLTDFCLTSNNTYFRDLSHSNIPRHNCKTHIEGRQTTAQRTHTYIHKGT